MKDKSGTEPGEADFFLQKFYGLQRLFSQLEFALAVVDPQLRLLHVNERFGSTIGAPPESEPRPTLKKISPQTARVIEPILRRVMIERSPLVDFSVEIPRDDANPNKAGRTWQVCCYPLKEQGGALLGASLAVLDVTDRKLREAAQVERLQFEALLSTLSATFINVPVSEVDAKITQGLQKIVEFLGFDRSSIWRLTTATDSGEMICTHSYQLPSIKPPPPVLPPGILPLWNEKVFSDEIFNVTDVDELPESYWREKLYCRERGGVRSILSIPAKVGGVVVGFITFVSYSVKREWPEELIQRLRLLWEIFANALERKRADQKIQKAMAEIETLKDRLQAENLYLRDQINIEHKHKEIIGQSGAIRQVLLRVEQVAATFSTALVIGETGTGKELIARAIHNLSSRKERPMITLNCAALPATLIEAELFGHEKGAFTGASSRQMGRFEAANGSTIFLDEIGELPLELQAKLLRVLQEGQFERLGSPAPVNVDVRVIAASNRNLAQAVKEGIFREDLFYRLNVFPISVPPLRERREDIPLLVWGMVREFSQLFGKTIERIPKKNMEALERYHWPGNIRELRNMVERAMILAKGTVLVIDVPDAAATAVSPAMTYEEMERAHIISVMERTGWRVRGTNGAAELLALKPTTLDSIMKRLGIARKRPFSEIS